MLVSAVPRGIRVATGEQGGGRILIAVHRLAPTGVAFLLVVIQALDFSRPSVAPFATMHWTFRRG